MRQTIHLGCAGCSQPQTQTEARSSRRDAIIQSYSIVFRGGSAPPSPAPIGWTACCGSAFLRRTAPALVRASPIGRKMTHTLIWREARMKHSVPIFGPSQSETLRDHIWCEIHTTWGMEFHPRTRPACRRARKERGQCHEQRVVVVVVVKILSIK